MLRLVIVRPAHFSCAPADSVDCLVGKKAAAKGLSVNGDTPSPTSNSNTLPVGARPSTAGSSPGMPTIAIEDDKRQDGSNSQDAPPSLPSKEAPGARSPAPGAQLTASQSSGSGNGGANGGSLSPYIGGSSKLPHRPGSSSGKRPMQAPPPPIREHRSSPNTRSPFPSSTPAKADEKNGTGPTASGSNASVVSATGSQGSDGGATGRAGLSRNASSDQVTTITESSSSTDARAAAEETLHSGPKVGLGINTNRAPDAAPSSERSRARPDIDEDLPSTEGKGGSHFSSSSETGDIENMSPYRLGLRKVQDASSERARLKLNGSPTRNLKPPSEVPNLTFKPSSRQSKAFSFYDPDLINLMDSFGRFDSSEDLKLSSPAVSEIEEAQRAQDKAQDSEANLARKGPTADDEVGEDDTPMVSEKHSDQSDVTAEPSHATSSEKEVLSEDQPVRRDSTASLSRLSAKMRASMKLARDGQVNMDISFIETVLKDLEDTREKMLSLQNKYDRIKRASQQAAHGFTMAKEEYEQEVHARYEAEIEMSKLKRQLMDQAFKLATLTSEKRQQEQLERRSQDVKASLKGMERDLAKLTAERDVTVAEVAELLALQDGSSKRGGDVADAKDAVLSSKLASRLEAVKSKYREEIDELTQERDSLLIEIEELKQSRELFLEEAQNLNAKNDELHAIISSLNKRIEAANQVRHAQLPPLPTNYDQASLQQPNGQHLQQGTKGGAGFGFGFNRTHKNHVGSSSMDSSSAMQVNDSGSIDSAVQKVIKPEKLEPVAVAKKFKWMKPKLSDNSKGSGTSSSTAANGQQPPVPPKISGPTPAAPGTAQRLAPNPHEMVVREHLFQPFNVLRPTRCLACQKSMWGQSEVRCALCAQVCHSRCLQSLSLSCNQPYTRPEEGSSEPQGPSMFGKDLLDQTAEEGREVPLVVEKCIQAVENFGMDYEGIYRKSGGSSQLKVITQLFERGGTFDLEDTDRFNDVSAITSVLKNYFRELPVPLLTFELHEAFIELSENKTMDAGSKIHQMRELIGRLPRQHYATLRYLVVHLHRVQQRAEENRMNARNLGVVFGRKWLTF